MWPFSRTDELAYRSLDSDFAIGSQITAADIDKVKAAGFNSILCARPDREEPGQPSFDSISQAAARAGLKAEHIPVSGQLTEGALIRMEQALATLPGPIFAYCRSGARAGSLYAAVKRAR